MTHVSDDASGRPFGELRSQWNDDTWELIDAAARALERDWSQVDLPILADYVPVDRDDCRYQEMLLQLIGIDHQCRIRNGVKKTLAEYVTEWPELQDKPGVVSLLEKNLRTNGKFEERLAATVVLGPQSGVAGTAPRGPESPLRVLCPNCSEPIDISGNDASESLSCPGCSRLFSPIDVHVPYKLSPGGSRQICRIIGECELREQLGRGAFGTVWRAWDPRLKRTVAVKIPINRQPTEQEAARFVQEAQAAAQLNHPGIVRVQAVGRDGEHLFIVYEFIEGVSLDGWKRKRKLTVQEVAHLCRQIAEAVDHAHEHHIIHRDLKPHNVLMDVDGDPHVADFGLAKTDLETFSDSPGSGANTCEGQVVGAPAYLSPEQASGRSHDVDARSDVYSLGVMLFELLTGELPFRGSLDMLLRQHREDDPPRPRRLVSSIPTDLETICLKCLEKSADKRYPSARALADELDRYLEGKPIHARPASSPERLWRWCKRQPVIASLSGTAAVLLISVAASTTFAYWSMSAVAEGNRQIAEAAELRSAEADYHRLVSRAQSLRESQPNTSLAAAIEAVRCAAKHDNLCNTEAVQVMIDCLCRNGGRPLSAHKGGVISITISPDARRFATVGIDGDIRLWDLPQDDTDMNSAAWTVTENTATAARFTPDCRWLVVGTRSGEIHCWDLSAPRGSAPQVRKKVGNSVLSIEVSPDGKWLAAAVLGQAVFLSEMSQENPLHAVTYLIDGVASKAERLAFSCDGKWLAAVDWEAGACLWRLYQGKPPSNSTALPTAGACAVAFDPSSTLLATGGFDGTTRIWPLTSKTRPVPPRALIARDGPVSVVRFSPDGSWLATGNEHPHASGVIRVWRVLREDGQKDGQGAADEVPSLPASDSPEPETLPTPFVSEPKSSERDCVTLYAHLGGIKAVEFTPDCQWLITAGQDGATKLWDLCALVPGGVVPSDVLAAHQAIVLHGHDGPVSAVAVSPDGRFLVSGDNREYAFLSRHTRPERRMDRVQMHHEIRPGVSQVLSDTRPYCVRVRRLDRIPFSGLASPLTRESMFASSATFSPDKRWIVVVGAESAPSTAQIHVVDSTPMRGIITNPPLLLPDVSTQFAEIYDLAASAPIRRVQKIALPNRQMFSPPQTFTDPGRSADVSGLQKVAISPSGRFLALWNTDDRLSLLDLHAGTAAERSLAKHAGVSIIGFNMDSKWLLGIDFDGAQLMRWISQGDEVQPNRLRLEGFSRCIQKASESSEFFFRGRVPRLAMISDDNRWLIGCQDEKTLVIWDLQEDGGGGLKPRILQHEQALIPQAINVEGTTLAMAIEGNTVCLWDLTAQHPEQSMRQIEVFKNRVKEVKLSPHSRWMVTAVESETHGTLWDLSQEKPSGIAIMGSTTTLEKMAFTPDEQTLIADVSDSLSIYPLPTQISSPRPLRLDPMLNITRMAPARDSLLSGPSMSIWPWPEVTPQFVVSPNGRWIVLDEPHSAWWRIGSRSVMVLPWRLEDLLAAASRVLPNTAVGPTAPQSNLVPREKSGHDYHHWAAPTRSPAPAVPPIGL